jgi:hypothetical protein
MVSVFISYAHADEELKKRFLVHLGALKRERLIDVWHDQMLRPGEHLDRAIEAELAAADLVILLVSPDFINSDYCTEKEMQRAFARAKDGRCRVVAVILKPSLWRDIPIDDEGGRLGDFVALPHDGKPVVRSRHGRESALDSVVAGIRRLIKDKSASNTVVRPRKKDDSSPRADVIYPPAVTLEPDVSLRDAIWNVLEPRKVDPVSKPLEVKKLAGEFRLAALDGRLPIWAKRRKSDAWKVLPREFWKDHRIVVLFDPRSTGFLIVERDSSDLSRDWPSYREFMTSRRAVDAQWPPAHRPSGDGRRRASASRVSSPRKRPSPLTADELACPICKTGAKPLDKIGDADGFECTNDGRFRVSSTVLAAPALREASRKKWEDALRRARARQPGEWAPTITTYDFD